MPFNARTTCDNGLGEFEAISATADTKAAALDLLGAALHEFMFEDPVTAEYKNGTEFLQNCRDFVVGDPNAATSVAIWTALQNSARSVECIETP